MNNTQEDNNRILVIANVDSLAKWWVVHEKSGKNSFTQDYVSSSDCDSVILARYAEKIKGKEQEFCPRCECKYENRNTTVIKVSSLIPIPLYGTYNFTIDFSPFQVVVIIVIWIISLLGIYMLFLNLLEPILNKRVKQNYSEHINNEEEASINSNTSSSSNGFNLHKIA